jgi:hypothetical protein
MFQDFENDPQNVGADNTLITDAIITLKALQHGLKNSAHTDNG